MTVETYLGLGAEAAKTRSQLSVELGISDRELRRRIAEARERGVPIVSSSRTAGYYIAATDAERRIAVGEYTARASKCLKAARKMSQFAIGQMTLEACHE